MSSFLYRWFGLGSLPPTMRPILEREGILLREEGCYGSVTLKHFRAPGRRHSWRRSGVIASVVVTRLRFAAFQYRTPVINVGLSHPAMGDLRCTLEGVRTLRIQHP